MRKWEGAEKDGVDDGEDGGIGADAESEGEHGDGGEAWSLAEHPQPESEVLKKGLHVASRLSAKLQTRPIVLQEWYFVPTHPPVPGIGQELAELVALKSLHEKESQRRNRLTTVPGVSLRPCSR